MDRISGDEDTGLDAVKLKEAINRVKMQTEYDDLSFEDE